MDEGLRLQGGYGYSIGNCWSEDSNLGHGGFVRAAFFCQVVGRGCITLIYGKLVSCQGNDLTQELNILFPSDDHFCSVMALKSVARMADYKVGATCVCVWIERRGCESLAGIFPWCDSDGRWCHVRWKDTLAN